MKTANRYILEPLPKLELDKNRFRVKVCPCGKSNKDGKFVPYVGFENKGYCHSCGKTFLPELQNDEQWKTPKPKLYKSRIATHQKKPVSFIPIDIFEASLKALETNNFVKFLINLFGVEVASEVVSRYFIATSEHWNGATVFWQIDIQGKVRTGKIMLYDPVTGKRVKEPFNHINWVHSLLKQPEFDLKQCLFGEHLLDIDKNKPVAIVESEKTAVIASVYLPRFTWVAVGSLTNLNAEKCSILKGRTVTLFPDLNGFEKWNSKAKELSHLTSFQVSDLLERKATEAERKQGLDLADYLTRLDFREFTSPQPGTTEPTPNNNAEPLQLTEKQMFTTVGEVFDYFRRLGFNSSHSNISQPENWEQDITELEHYFSGINLPPHPVRLDQCSTITDCRLFIETHIATIKANNGNRTFLPYLDRLNELKTIMQ